MAFGTVSELVGDKTSPIHSFIVPTYHSSSNEKDLELRTRLAEHLVASQRKLKSPRKHQHEIHHEEIPADGIIHHKEEEHSAHEAVHVAVHGHIGHNAHGHGHGHEIDGRLR